MTEISAIDDFDREAVAREEKARAEGIRKSITKRLRKACSYMSEEDFNALVDKMTKMQMTGDRRSL